MSLSFPLPHEADTQRLGQLFAQVLLNNECTVLLLKGSLGAGKTTLVRHIIQALPHGDQAEVSSPSFTLMNMYDTTPPVKHFDLYRLDPFIYDEALDEALDDVDNVVFIEWAERIPNHLLPLDYLECTLTLEKNGRQATLKAQGPLSEKALRFFTQDSAPNNL